ncbi:MAG: DinB family protein [Bacteroidota bacterium]
MKRNRIISHIIEQLQEVQNGKLWMGDTFMKKLDSITAEEAFIRPLPNLHSVAELIAHLTAWKKDAFLKVRNGKGILTADDGGNWPSIQVLKEIGWEKLIEEYENSHLNLVNVLQEKEDTFLQEPYEDQDFKNTFSYSFLIDGILHHDLYHLGQIGVVIKLIKEKSNTQ